MALNLGVTSCQSLEISLDQFVRGEVLEGSNAYYCEKCKEKVFHVPSMYFVFNVRSVLSSIVTSVRLCHPFCLHGSEA